MHDQHAWAPALAHLRALKTNLPYMITEEVVTGYHRILKALQNASGKDFSAFSIPDSDLKPDRFDSVSYSHLQPSTTRYSKERYGDTQSFKRRVVAAEMYANQIDSANCAAAGTNEPKDYWTMPTVELEHLAGRYGIGGYADQMMHVDRNLIIQQLLARDAALKPEKPVPPPSHAIHVGTVTNSVIQQHSSGAHAIASSPPAHTPKSRAFSSWGVAEKVAGSLIAAGLLTLLGYFGKWFLQHWHW